MRACEKYVHKKDKCMKLLLYWPATIMGLGAFMATFDVTAVSLALPEIRDELSLDVST